MSDLPPPRTTPFDSFVNAIYYLLDAPVTWAREKIVANRPKYYYYHRKYRRVPTIDQCYTDDVLCMYEADEQFRRDMEVDTEILHILRFRYDDCLFYECPDQEENCKKVKEDYEESAVNWFIKYGDLGAFGKARDCYMKQKHRLIWERRHPQQNETSNEK